MTVGISTAVAGSPRSRIATNLWCFALNRQPTSENFLADKGHRLGARGVVKIYIGISDPLDGGPKLFRERGDQTSRRPLFI